MIRKIILGFFATLSCVAIAFAVAQEPPPQPPQTPAPQDPGQVILNRACTVCHMLTEITKFKGYYSRDQWADVVRTMRADGAQVKDEEATLLVDYIFKTYGRVDPPAGQKIFEESCAECHDLETTSNLKLRKADWQGLVNRMIGKGASVEEAQIPALVDYLAATFKPDPSPGK